MIATVPPDPHVCGLHRMKTLCRVLTVEHPAANWAAAGDRDELRRWHGDPISKSHRHESLTDEPRPRMPNKRSAEAVEIELGVSAYTVANARSAAQALLDVRWPRRENLITFA
jgi:hypothetical protein